MFKNYFKVTFRNLSKHKTYSVINLLGLAIGISSFLLILLYVNDELNYDNFHDNADRIYRLNWDYKWQGREGIGPGTPPPLAKMLTDEIPEIEVATRIYPVSKMVVRKENNFFAESRILAVDASFFEVFSFKMPSGDPATALQEPNSVILTEETAQKYFGDASPVGKTLSIGESKSFLGKPYSNLFKITGVVTAAPQNSHFQFDMLTSMASHPQVAFFDWSWVWMQVVTYAVVNERAALGEMEAKIADLVSQRAPDAFRRIGFSFEDMIEQGGHWKFVFQPLTDIHLGSARVGNRLGPVGNKSYVYIFSAVALFVLLIACINFMNLSTARSSGRAKEVGVRKVLGSVKRNLINQFMVESLVFSGVALLLSLGLVELLLGSFNQIADKSLHFNLFQPVWLPVFLIALTLAVGLVAGSYPGFYLSSFRPVEVLKGRINAGMKSSGLRNALVVVQFAISIALIICSLLVKDQLDFVTEKDMGFAKESVLIISNENHRLGDNAKTYRDLVKGKSEIVNASLTTGVPPVFGFQDYYKVEGVEAEQTDLVSYMTDENFVQTLGLKIVQGRGFAKEFSTDDRSVILNETAVRQFGWKDAIGKKITYPSRGDYTVIGVMRDFNFTSLHRQIVPFALFHVSSNSYTIPDSYIAIRVRTRELGKLLRRLETEWHALAPATPFEYSFLDDNLESQYRAEQRLGNIFLIFTSLAILVACLGLFGLTSYSAEQRTQEIGIRKVLGASVAAITMALLKEFTKWVLVANLIAWPVAWFAMNRWLQNFAYRIDISWSVFALAGGLALVIALLTVSTQAIGAALANPVESLRYE
ncbi:MAG: ABC transporter permease [bacterium]